MKNRGIYGLLAILLLLAITGGGVSALGSADYFRFTNSPQSEVTQGLFRSDADNFIRTDTWTDLSFDNFFAYSSFASTSDLELGFATNVSGIYAGAYYNGNFSAEKQSFNSTEMEAPWAGSYKTFTVYTGGNSPFSLNYPNNHNQFSIIAGMMGMGFRFSWYDSSRYFSGTDVSDGSTAYKSYRAGSGIFGPQLEWALTNDILDAGIRPKVTLDLIFTRDFARGEQYANPPTDNTTFNEQVLNSENVFTPQLTFAAGGYRLIESNNITVIADFAWTLNFDIYNNDLSIPITTNPVASYYKTISIKGLNDGSDTSYYSESSRIQNIFTPSIAAYIDAGAFNFAFKFNLPLDFNSGSSKTMFSAAGNDVFVNTGSNSRYTMFTFIPVIEFGMQWYTIPGKLTVNFGANISFGSRSITYRDEEVIAGATQAHTNTVSKYTYYEDTSNTLSLGLSFNLTENVNIQATSGFSNNMLNVFGTGTTSANRGVFVFGQLLLAVKY